MLRMITWIMVLALWVYVISLFIRAHLSLYCFLTLYMVLSYSHMRIYKLVSLFLVEFIWYRVRIDDIKHYNTVLKCVRPCCLHVKVTLVHNCFNKMPWKCAWDSYQLSRISRSIPILMLISQVHPPNLIPKCGGEITQVQIDWMNN